MTFSQTAQLGMAMRFDVSIDAYDLGSWSTCKGLAMTFKHVKVKELGQHEYTTHIPGRVEYTKVTLQRALAAGDWEKTRTWLAKVSSADWLLGDMDAGAAKSLKFTSSGGSGASITLRDSKLEDVATWTLSNALPIAWKGPQLDALGKKVAIETLELIHDGFLDA